MPNTPQPIQFLLHQLATNEEDRKRFNQLIPENILRCMFTQSGFVGFVVGSDDGYYSESFDYLSEIYKEKILRTCLSRVDIDGDSVLDVFKSYHVQLNCYLAFDFELRNGKPLDTAIQALHEKMLELVPEYREFITTK